VAGDGAGVRLNAAAPRQAIAPTQQSPALRSGRAGYGACRR
jgi:hypothetical protein